MPWSTVGVIAGLAALVGGGWFWWWWPKRQVDRLRLTIRDPKARADVEDNFRKTIGQILGGAAVLIGAGLAYYGTQQTLRATADQARRSDQAAHDLLISNQVSSGFLQLGNEESMVVRLGGIYALEGVMNTSEQYHRPVLEALSAFVRDGTRTATGDGPPATDIQAALTVIGRRAAIGTGFPDLAHAHIPQTDLSDANLSGANLSHAHLERADLTSAILSDANLSGLAEKTIATRAGNIKAIHGFDFDTSDPADLSDANLYNADLSGALLMRANLSGAKLIATKLSRSHLNGANLSHAHLEMADLTFADLAGANLSHANLSYATLTANLSRADLSGATLTRANLGGADLTGAIVSQEQLNTACGTKAKLDTGLTLKPC